MRKKISFILLFMIFFAACKDNDENIKKPINKIKKKLVLNKALMMFFTPIFQGNGIMVRM